MPTKNTNNEWEKMKFLRDKVLYWLFRRENASRARLYAERLAPLLSAADPDHEAIFGEECWSLVHETRGDLPRAIEHRHREIDLIRRLHEIARGQLYEGIALRDYGYIDLSDRLNLLATLYHDSGDSEKAIRTLEESKQLCADHGVKFGGEDLLKEYVQEATFPKQKHVSTASSPALTPEMTLQLCG
jgi:hypothetical protein